MALGRCEALFEQTGEPSRITCPIGIDRHHLAWDGNPAYDRNSKQAIIDGGGFRPYIKHWKGKRSIFNLDHRPRAGKIHLTQDEIDYNDLEGDYIIVAPHLKKEASPNKDWGFDKWQKVIDGLEGVKVYQLIESDKQKKLNSAIGLKTETFRLAASIISKAKLVLSNEGGSHHMAASMGVPAIVIFGSFVPPEVTGYDFHANITTQEAHYCGDWSKCDECQKALDKITPDMVLSLTRDCLNEKEIKGIYRV